MRWFDRSPVGRALDWNLSLSNFDAWSASPHGDGIMKLRYEDLVEDPKREVRAVCRFLKTTYDHDMLAVTEHNSSFFGSSRPGNLKDALRRGNLLRPWERLCIETVCGRHMLREGYALTMVPAAAVRGLDALGAYRGLDRVHQLLRRGLFALVPTRKTDTATGR